jgi:hypothetical protein
VFFVLRLAEDGQVFGQSFSRGIVEVVGVRVGYEDRVNETEVEVEGAGPGGCGGRWECLGTGALLPVGSASGRLEGSSHPTARRGLRAVPD